MTAADALATLLDEEWEPAIPGRTTDVPDIVASREAGTGVILYVDEEESRSRTSSHDIIECKYLDQQVTDKGSNSEQITDLVQIEIRLSDRDIDGDGLRESAKERMIGTRDANNDAETLGGLKGEVKRILNGIRKGFKEWDKSSHTVDQQELENSDARVVFTVKLTIIERDIEQPI